MPDHTRRRTTSTGSVIQPLQPQELEEAFADSKAADLAKAAHLEHQIEEMKAEIARLEDDIAAAAQQVQELRARWG